uniref:Uncharacterized protein n=1 Tax=Mus musculus TaxID=10090 RepID=Q3UNW1_MOUSE|nr:unnamed protein product [Mus musculus]
MTCPKVGPVLVVNLGNSTHGGRPAYCICVVYLSKFTSFSVLNSICRYCSPRDRHHMPACLSGKG